MADVMYVILPVVDLTEPDQKGGPRGAADENLLCPLCGQSRVTYAIEIAGNGRVTLIGIHENCLGRLRRMVQLRRAAERFPLDNPFDS